MNPILQTKIIKQPEPLDEGLLYSALRYISELMLDSRQPFMLLGETLDSALDGELAGDKLHIGILEKHASALVFNTNFSGDRIVNWQEYPDKFTFTVDLVPVVIEFLPNEDWAIYQGNLWYKDIIEGIGVPNPRNKYEEWKAKLTKLEDGDLKL